MHGLKHPATIIALVALFVALGSGAALASGVVSGRQIADHSIPEWKLTRRAISSLRGHSRSPKKHVGSSTANALAQASGLVAWTVDPALISTTRTGTSGTIHGGSVWLKRGDTINWLAELVTANGSGLTHGAFAVYDSSLKLVAQTTDKPTAFASASADTWVKLPLSARYTVRSSGLYYLVDFLAGTTTPTVGIATINSALGGRNLLPSGVPRGVRDGASLSAFPSTLTNSSTDETRCILAGGSRRHRRRQR